MTVTTTEPPAVHHHRARIAPPMRVDIELEQLWIHGDRDAVRITASDLRGLSRQAAQSRIDHPDADLLADIHAAIDWDAGVARTELAKNSRPLPEAALVYVGTPAGLAGLIADIRTLGIADGAVITPLLPDRGIDLICTAVLPRLGLASRLAVEN